MYCFIVLTCFKKFIVWSVLFFQVQSRSAAVGQGGAGGPTRNSKRCNTKRLVTRLVQHEDTRSADSNWRCNWSRMELFWDTCRWSGTREIQFIECKTSQDISVSLSCWEIWEWTLTSMRIAWQLLRVSGWRWGRGKGNGESCEETCKGRGSDVVRTWFRVAPFVSIDAPWHTKGYQGIPRCNV